MKEKPAARRLALWAARVVSPFGRLSLLSSACRYVTFFQEWRNFGKAGGEAKLLDWYPCLHDRTASTGIDTHYFYQAIWAFGRITEHKANLHVDVGSQVNLVGILTAVARVVFLDIRPLMLRLSGYTGVAASLTALPCPDGTVHSLSSLHVIEHIGLGRYGDPIDPSGSIRAAREIARVLAPGGHAYVSVPIGRSRVQFNGQRVFSVDDVISMFSGLELKELSTVTPRGLYQQGVDPNTCIPQEAGAGLDYGLGMFLFEKPARLPASTPVSVPGLSH